MKFFKVSKKVATASIAAGLLLVPLGVMALADDEDTVINANIGSTISITTSGTVDLDITPTEDGSATSDEDTVSVSTNNADGYTLTLANNDSTLTLVGDDGSIAQHTGTFGVPTTLANNSWGYRVDGLGDFGAGPTEAEDNEENLAGLWAGVPANNAPVTINGAGGPVSGDETTVWFGAKADTSKPNGTYTDTVVYTATAL